MLKIFFLIFMGAGIPVAIAMATASLIYIWVSGTSPSMVVVHRMISGIDSFPLLAVPFFILAVGLMIQMMLRMGRLQMTIIDLPMNIIYGICAFGFACAAFRSVQVAIENWRRGWSLLERPEHAIEETI